VKYRTSEKEGGKEEKRTESKKGRRKNENKSKVTKKGRPEGSTD
jgi:hypothetical protein